MFQKTNAMGRVAMAAVLMAPVALLPFAPSAGLSVLSPAAHAQGVPPALVRTGKAQEQLVQQRRLVIGQFRAARRSDVAAQEEGRVTAAPPDAGTVVKAGQVLAELDASLLKLEQATMSAQLEEAKALVTQREAGLSRIQRQNDQIVALAKTGAANDKEKQDAADDVLVAQAQLAQAKAAVATQTQRVAEIEERIARMQVVAPFDGYVVTKHAEVGEWLSAGDMVVALVQTAPLDATFDVPETLVDKLAVGTELMLTVPGRPDPQNAAIDRIVPDVDTVSRTFPVIVRLDNADGRFRPGMTVQAMVPTSEQTQAVTVPRDAVLITQQGAQVVVNNNGTAQTVPVTIRFGVDDRYVIQGPIRPGTDVVVEGNERLFTGQTLNPMQAPGAPGAPGAPEAAPLVATKPLKVDVCQPWSPALVGAHG